MKSITVNHISIPCPKHEGTYFCAIKSICEALQISFSKQRKKILSDPILCSVMAHRATTGADGKTYKMFCLPVKYTLGWLFTINPNLVKPEARDILIQYKRECYEALFKHFFPTENDLLDADIEENKGLIEILLKEEDAKNGLKSANQSLKEIRHDKESYQGKLLLRYKQRHQVELELEA